MKGHERSDIPSRDFSKLKNNLKNNPIQIWLGPRENFLLKIHKFGQKSDFISLINYRLYDFFNFSRKKAIIGMTIFEKIEKIINRVNRLRSGSPR